MGTALALITAVGTVTVGALGVWVSYQEVPDRRAQRIRRDLEILDALPADSDARSELRAHIERAISTMLEDRKQSRNLSSAFFGLFTVAYAFFLYGLGTSQGSWWRLGWVPAALFVVAGTFGLVDGLKRGERDSQGLIVGRWQQRRMEARQAAEQAPPVQDSERDPAHSAGSKTDSSGRVTGAHPAGSAGSSGGPIWEAERSPSSL